MRAVSRIVDLVGILRLPSNWLYDGSVKQETDVNANDSSLSWALCFEVGLGVIALVLGQLTSVWPGARLVPWTFGIFVVGILSAVPPLLIMLSLRRVQWAPLRDLTVLVDEKLTPMFRGLSVWHLAMLSFAAGWGEELLFRGLIQGEITYHTNIITGIAVASFVFGLVHFLSPAYFFMALSVSIYFGWLYWQFNSLWVPILGHAVYDFLMLMFLQRKDEAALESTA